MTKVEDLDFPLLDVVTSDEIHRELVALLLKRHKVRDPDRFIKENSIESRVSFRNIKVGDVTQLVASVAIYKATIKDATSSPSGPGDAKNS